METLLDHYAVMGNPIAHSQSPFIHQAFAQQVDHILTYIPLLVGMQPGEFAQAVHDFQQRGGKGLNITVPFKEEAYALAEVRSERAERAGAVNTLWFDAQGQLVGDNTDGVGLIRDIQRNHGTQVAGKRLLILGAGGAVRGVLGPLLDEAPQCCVIANRTVAKAQALAELFSRQGQVTACAYTALVGQHFDLIINGTSAGLQNQLPPLPDDILTEIGGCYDMLYGRTPTLFTQWAREHAASYALDGLGMLVEQAAEAFYLWRGVMPQTLPVVQQLRTHLTGSTR